MKAMPEPTLAQQRVLDRIAVQRERLRARCAANAQARDEAQAGAFPLGPLLSQGLALAGQHPRALLVLVGLALAAGPKRLLRWGGVLLPVLLKMRR